MYQRVILEQLESWKTSPNRKPLVLRGARQVGKTTAVFQFSKSYSKFLAFNLEIPSHRLIFEQNNEANQLVQALCFFRQFPLPQRNESTLLFIDEIQECPEAVSMLRYLYEQVPNLHVIAAGSMLENALDTKRVSFPVGRVEFAYMYPLDFCEFLGAIGEKSSQEILSKVPVPQYAHSKLTELFRQYTLVGGMPEIVSRYSETRDHQILTGVYESLAISYIDDARKYARTQSSIRVLEHILGIAPKEASSRIVFSGFGNSNYKSREVGEAFRTLEKAMLLKLVYPTTSETLPLIPNISKHPKLQYLDTGLVNYQAGLRGQFFEQKDLHSIFNGRIAEHIVGQQILASQRLTSPTLNFWCRESPQSNAEIDFVVPFQNHLVPVEVKSGATGTLRSLFEFMDRTNHPIAVRFFDSFYSQHDVTTTKGTKFKLLNLPHYLAGQLDKWLAWHYSEMNLSGNPYPPVKPSSFSDNRG